MTEQNLNVLTYQDGKLPNGDVVEYHVSVQPIDFVGKDSEVHGYVRTVLFQYNNEWISMICLKDLAIILGYINTKDAIRKHIMNKNSDTLRFSTPVFVDSMETGRPKVAYRDLCSVLDMNKQRKSLLFGNQTAIFNLIRGSELPSAEEFNYYVDSVILPNIANQGYHVEPTNGFFSQSIARQVINTIQVKPYESNHRTLCRETRKLFVRMYLKERNVGYRHSLAAISDLLNIAITGHKSMDLYYITHIDADDLIRDYMTDDVIALYHEAETRFIDLLSRNRFTVDNYMPILYEIQNKSSFTPFVSSGYNITKPMYLLPFDLSKLQWFDYQLYTTTYSPLYVFNNNQ